MSKFLIPIAVLALCGLPSSAMSAVYKFVDPTNGHVQYDDKPHDDRWVKVVDDPTPEEKEAWRKEVLDEIKYQRWLEQQEYMRRVKKTAKFLDDVEAERKRRQHKH
jgi:ABC-type uncharacterized transport system ATPase subunit